MKFLLRIKHWQLFCLLLIPTLVMQFTLIGSGFNSAFLPVFALVMIANLVLFFGWIYTLGVNLHPKLPATVRMNLNRFKLFLFVPVIYISLFLLFLMSGSSFGDGIAGLAIALIIPLHFFSMFCIFYSLYFVAKTLKAVELQKQVEFADYAGEFFLMWFFMIGIWLIQPRINKMFDGRQVRDQL